MHDRASLLWPASALGQALVFTLLAYLLSWPLWLAVLAGWLPLTPFGSFAPSLAALLLTGIWDGRSGLRLLARSLLRWRVPLRVYVVAVLGPPLVHLLAILLTSGPSGLKPGPLAMPGYLLFLAPLEILVLGGPLGEEIGWRGFALPRLLKRFGPLAASLGVALVWCIWHVPLFFIPGSGQAEIPFPLFALTLAAYSVVLTWLYLRSSGSLLLAILFHTSVNTSFFVVQSLFQPAFSAPFFGRAFVTVALAWGAVAGIALVRAGRRTEPAP